MMMKAQKEVTLGLFVIVSLLCIFYLTIKLGRMDYFQTGKYTLNANFNSVSGLREGAKIEIAGVQVGNVGAIELDQTISMAAVKLYIDNGIRVTDDSVAAIKTEGLIGEKFIEITIGASSDILTENDVIFDTQSPVDLIELIGKYALGSVD